MQIDDRQSSRQAYVIALAKYLLNYSENLDVFTSTMTNQKKNKYFCVEKNVGTGNKWNQISISVLLLMSHVNLAFFSLNFYFFICEMRILSNLKIYFETGIYQYQIINKWYLLALHITLVNLFTIVETENKILYLKLLCVFEEYLVQLNR